MVGDSLLLSVETEETGADTEIVAETWAVGDWGKCPVESTMAAKILSEPMQGVKHK